MASCESRSTSTTPVNTRNEAFTPSSTMISSTRVAFMLSGCVFSSGAIAASWSLYFGMLIGAPPTRVFENGRMEALHMWLLPVGVLATIVTAVHVALLLVASPSGGCQPCDRACKGAVTVALFW